MIECNINNDSQYYGLDKYIKICNITDLTMININNFN